MNDDLDDLTRRMTNRMMELDRQVRRRRLLWSAVGGLIVLLIVGAAVVLLLEGYGADLRESMHFPWESNR